MFGIFKKKTRRAAAEIKKFEKRDLAQAVINAAYLVAYADGECEASEKAKIEQVLRNQPALSARLPRKLMRLAQLLSVSWIPILKLVVVPRYARLRM
ncbi:tellurite resistance TerB family protein [Escherichia coli]|nr:tellurite resistance TerB family protein [Escherichia coli]EFD4066538.1 tellurite resistance TerB family protein [Escherichia coli]EFM5392320.1 tellurite resistance TerB family protein [Escherichia coli]EFM5449572.1 tellurite resistance TerB family protein [Escherichia coli]